MKTKTLLTAIAGAAALLLAGCALAPEQEPVPQLTFEAPVAINADQEFHVRLGVRNAGTQDFAGDKRFKGQMELRDASGELQASAEVVELPAIPAGDTEWLIEWRGRLAPGDYRLTWGSDKYGFITVEFTIVERDGRLYLAENAPPEEVTGEVEHLTAQAITDLASRLGIGADQITVESVTPTEFPDASLGVPEPGMVYAQVITPGYIIQLKANGRPYEYHAAGDRVVPVPDGAASVEYRPVEIPEAGLRFEVPADWQQQAPEIVWTPQEDGDLRLGVNWMALEPPVEPEAAMLPNHAQIVASEPVELGWADGRRFTLEVYGPAAEGGSQAPVESVETHVLVVIRSDEGRRGFDFYASAPTAKQLAEIEPALNHALETAVLGGADTAGESRTAGWPVLYDETYGFQLAYPEDWTHQDLGTQGAGMPDDWPVRRVVVLYPQAWADRFERSGPPDPEAPPAIPAISLEVCVGSEEQFRRAYVAPDRSETLTINGIEVVREEQGPDERARQVLYVFQDPANPDLRVVLIDNFGGYADRVAENREIVEMIPLVVATFEFASTGPA